MATKKAPAAPAKAAKTAAAPKAEKKEKAPKPPKVERATSNGITKPKEDSTTGRIWAIADEISKAQKRPASRAEVMEKAVAEEINEATVATQYQRWRTFYGVERQAPVPKPLAAPAKKAAKGSTAPA